MVAGAGVIFSTPTAMFNRPAGQPSQNRQRPQPLCCDDDHTTVRVADGSAALREGRARKNPLRWQRVDPSYSKKSGLLSLWL